MLDKYVSQSCLAAITNGEAAIGRIPFASLLPLAPWYSKLYQGTTGT